MGITFTCEHCRREIQAPESAAGKRGKCPFCTQTTYIPLPVSEDDILDLAPIDEEEERRREEQIRQLHAAEKELLADKSDPAEPITERKNVTSEELYHFVVNYCLDMANGRLERAETIVARLKKFGYAGHQAIEDFLMGKAIEPALDIIPKKVLEGFLTQLADRMRQR
ncbi:MAG: hypothetical protein EHM48_03230 [Planctomycetaceae bacterium]|nr:MAG: hypothetical protein EHM48_03230 [Planctomycetaceae bacterium]